MSQRVQPEGLSRACYHCRAARHERCSACVHPDGVNLIQANRRAAFHGVFHFHVHVIPRWWDDGIALPWKHEPGEPDVLRETAETIRGAMVRPGGGR